MKALLLVTLVAMLSGCGAIQKQFNLQPGCDPYNGKPKFTLDPYDFYNSTDIAQPWLPPCNEVRR